MKFVCNSACIQDYLIELDEVNYSHPKIQETAKTIFTKTQTDIEKAKSTFEFVRDEVFHSWDIQDEAVTCKASDVLMLKKGICYAKSHLLAALLRSQGIPTGFCYQRLMLFDTPEKGFCIHALNAVYLQSVGKWVRVDARGNKEGVNAQFSINEEKLAFTVHEAFGEIDYPIIFSHPHPKIVAVLNEHSNVLDMYKYHLPDEIGYF